MNLHPIFVHFPIALLTIYALLEFASIQKVRSWEPWLYIKSAFLIIGTGASYLAYLTGNALESQFRHGSLAHIVELHSHWAVATMLIFTGITALYLIEIIKKTPTLSSYAEKTGMLWRVVVPIQKTFSSRFFLILFALSGLLAITVTGGLGGSIVYGQDIDPVVSLIYRFIAQ
jgi:uncharacterized membrane protein